MYKSKSLKNNHRSFLAAMQLVLSYLQIQSAQCNADCLLGTAAYFWF